MVRPTPYKEEYDEQVYKLCLLGATDKDLADFFNVCEKTINNWKHNHPAFLQSIKRGKIEADTKIAESLYHKAMGYKHRETKLFQTYKDGELEIVEHDVCKHYAPDTTALIFWLKNRQPDKWRDKTEVEQTNRNVRIKISRKKEDD